jgi:hypothetical protein
MDTYTNAPQAPADRAHEVGHEAKQAAQDVASTAAHEAGRTTREAKDQARQLLSQTRTELTDQAATQQIRAATGLRELAEQFGSLARTSDQDGMARSLVEDVSRRAGDAADWLDQRDPGTLLQEVRGVARRRPGTFLAVAAGLGVLAGRLSRSLAEEAGDSSEESGTGTGTETGTGTGTGTAGTGTGNGMAGNGTAAMPMATPGVQRTTQPMAPDGTLTPIDENGRLGAPVDPFPADPR